MSRYIVSPEASRDLDEISDYFAARNIEAGEQFVEEFNRKCRNLINFPICMVRTADIISITAAPEEDRGHGSAVSLLHGRDTALPYPDSE